ncbi:c-type cytochrome [Mangrovicoccus ximenensis]|uniref:c-type cytochrome n=1 Tax=Mangrovicoccus ximenensis TaxID=1911570 RepID=UPI000D353517|nr:c-type cytochrome [Mangrovicoccus ximenensis]
MIRAALIVLGGGFLAQAAIAQEGGGDPEAGRKVAGMCRTCHGLEGYAKIPIAPHIGGEPAGYLRRQLDAFRDGSREHEMMTIVAKGLTDRQVLDVTAWYEAQDATATLTADPSGAPELCSSCHGVDGIAIAPDAPNLANETAMYVDTQLKAFRIGKRHSEIMGPIAEGLSDEEIRAAADWYAGVKLTIKPGPQAN